MPPESSSERTSSLVKKGLPFGRLVEPLGTGSAESSEPPTSDLDERAVLGGRERPERDRRRSARSSAEAVQHPA